MNKELIRLIHNECTPEERLGLMRQMEQDHSLAQEYKDLLEFDESLKHIFSDASKAEFGIPQKTAAPRAFPYRILAASLAAAASVALAWGIFKAPATGTIQERQSPTFIVHEAPDDGTSKSPFSDKRKYVARLSPAQESMAKMLAASAINETLEIQSRSAASAKIKDILKAPYIPKTGRDFKAQRTSQEAIEMLLANSPEDNGTLLGFVPSIY